MCYGKRSGSNENRTDIRALRIERNLFINDLTEVIGITPGLLGLIERGLGGKTSSFLVSVSEAFKI